MNFTEFNESLFNTPVPATIYDTSYIKQFCDGYLINLPLAFSITIVVFTGICIYLNLRNYPAIKDIQDVVIYLSFLMAGILTSIYLWAVI
jgi:hypothetical protein